MRVRIVLGVVSAVMIVAFGNAGALGTASSVKSGVAPTACNPARVNYTRYPGGDSGLGGLPWIRGAPRAVGLVGLLWYWPESWRQRRLRPARIFTGGVAPAGYSTKILWVFLGRSAKGGGGARLVVRGRRLDQQGSFTQKFAAISYAGQQGAPSYASIIDVPTAGCWRLQLSAGTLRASVVFQAVRAAEQPTLCTEEEVETLVGRFIGAFNTGDAGQLEGIFAREPEFEWYTTDAPGERLTPLAYDRPSLVPYFRDRHALGEQLTLRSFRFNGNTTGSRTYGNFEYALTRSAGDLGPTPYFGKGAALCYRNRSDAIFVWSMARA
jgi:hypothetical protein